MPLNTTSPACLYYGLLSNAEADLATIPSNETWVALSIEATNVDTGARTFTLKHVPDGDSTGDQHVIGFGKAMTIAASPKVYRATGRWVMAPDGKIRGGADASNKIVVRIDGFKVTTP